VKQFAEKFYKSSRWRKCRDAYFVSQHGVCERCQGKNGSGLIVHHTVWLTPENINDPDISLNHELLELLCQTCHNQEHHKSEVTIRDDVTFDDEGNLIQVRE
jgi:5-methylcytosine-specific restriction endonuclease McrA